MAFWFPQLTYNAFIKGSAACAATATCRPALVWIYKAQGISVVRQTRREKLLVAFCHASDLAPGPSSNESSPCGIRRIILSNASLLKCQFPDSSPEFRDLLASVVVQLLACSECGSSGNHTAAVCLSTGYWEPCSRMRLVWEWVRWLRFFFLLHPICKNLEDWNPPCKRGWLKAWPRI